jgi:hypothetical protein
VWEFLVFRGSELRNKTKRKTKKNKAGIKNTVREAEEEGPSLPESSASSLRNCSIPVSKNGK